MPWWLSRYGLNSQKTIYIGPVGCSSKMSPPSCPTENRTWGLGLNFPHPSKNQAEKRNHLCGDITICTQQNCLIHSLITGPEIDSQHMHNSTCRSPSFINVLFYVRHDICFLKKCGDKKNIVHKKDNIKNCKHHYSALPIFIKKCRNVLTFL